MTSYLQMSPNGAQHSSKQNYSAELEAAINKQITAELQVSGKCSARDLNECL
jgi:hypothetical protein